MTPGEALIADAAAKVALLSRRELEALDLAAKGLSADETGRAMSCSMSTVQGFRKTAYNKLGVDTVCEAVVILTTARVAAMLPRVGGPAAESGGALGEVLQALRRIEERIGAAVAGATAPAAEAPPEPAQPKARGRMWDYQGRKITTKALAAIAGVRTDTMLYRLQHNTVEEALAIGKADKARKRPRMPQLFPKREAPAQFANDEPVIPQFVQVQRAPEQPGARAIRSGVVHSAGGVTRHTMGD